MTRLVDEGKVEEVIKAIQRLVVSTPEQKEILEGEIAYFEKHKDRMRYATQTVRNALDGKRGKQYHNPTVLHSQ